ncbi:CYTH and CHAD domain-containing protein [Arthrobacter sp. D1-17]
MNPEGLEAEKKYDVDPGAALPALQRIAGIGRVGEPSEAVLEAVYFDTSDFALAARRITLRRRTGGADAGWHLKLAPELKGSSDGGTDPVPQRREIHAPLGQADVVPDQLLVHLHAYLRGAAAAPAARLKTRRTTYPLYGDDGMHLADFADDRVESQALGSGLKQEWREWELELVRGNVDLFPSAEACFAAAGARPASHESKLGRALGDAWPERQDTAPGAEAGGNAGAKQPGSKAAGKKEPASDVVTAYLGAHIAQLVRTDPAVRLEEPDAVHQMRSATRRLRSALAVYRKLFGDAAVRRLRDELRWLGRILGAPRDAEVTRERILAGVGALPPEQADAVKDRLERELGDRFAAGYRRVQEVLVSERYYRLLDDLEEFRDNPPALPAAAAPAARVTGKRIGRTIRRLRRSAKAARQDKAGPAHDAALHQVRKDAKRLRHAAESAIPLYGKRAARLADAAHRQQKILGDHHDSVMARTLLGKLARGPQQSEHVSAAYARLLRKEVKAAARAEAKYRKERRKARKLLKRGVA